MVDGNTLQPDDFAKRMQLLRFRTDSVYVFLKALFSTEEMEVLKYAGIRNGIRWRFERKTG